MATSGTLDRYRDLKTLGSGGMGTVTLAEDTMLGRRVALKRLHTAGDIRGVSRLRREALVGASLSHPNLVSVYDVLTDQNDDLVVVMEYVAGETLRDTVRRGSGLPVAHALRVLAGVASGLDAIHGRGIVHRDVKPANILLGTDGAIKLADLGVASAADRTQITTDGAVLGTFSYMAPEQLEGSNSDAAMDIYALSAVAYEVLSGRKARPEPNPLALAHAISTQPPPDLREVWPQAPQAVATVLLRGMARDPARRPRSAGELVSRLRESFEPATTAGAPARPARPPAPVPSEARPTSDAASLADGAAPPTPSDADRSVPSQRADVPGRKGAYAAGGAVVGAAAAGAMAPRDSSALSSPPASDDQAIAPRAHSAQSPPTSAPRRGGEGPGPGRTRPRAGGPAATGGRRRGLLAAGLLALAAAIVAAVVLGASGGSPHHATPAVANAGHTSSPKPAGAAHPAPARGSASGTGSASRATPSGAAGSAAGATPAGGAPVPAANTPVGAVQAFYELATQHNYSAAWNLADPAARSQLQGYGSFVAQQGATRSITFNQASASQQGNTATVALQTTSVRNDGTHQCSGSVAVVNTGSSWRVHAFQGINCSP